MKYSVYQRVPLPKQVVQVIFSLCFFIPYMVNSSILYAAMMTFWLVALLGFLIISSVSGIVNVMCFVVPEAAFLLIFGSMEAIVIAPWAQ
jgi:hypothetical protein